MMNAKLALAAGILLALGAGCTSQEDVGAAAKARVLAERQQQNAPAPAPTGDPRDGVYCNEKLPNFCDRVSFTTMTVTSLFKGAEVDEFKLVQQGDKFTFTGTEVNAVTFVKIVDAQTLEYTTMYTGADAQQSVVIVMKR